jgi:L-threonylcarbamoyladenylate synthase
MDRDELVETILSGGVAIMPTDTLYGVVASAFSPESIERVYEVKQRNLLKPLIVLISSLEEVERFGVVLSDDLVRTLRNYWPGPNSIILPTIDESFEYLSRGSQGIAFRVPGDEVLCELLRETGPLVAPSANIEGKKTVESASEAQRVFGALVDLIVDGGVRTGEPSTLLSLDESGDLHVERAGRGGASGEALTQY